MNYKKLVPPDSFIGQYMEYMSYVETAESYDFWCALWAIGVGCGRDCFVDRPNSPVFLNWYIILAAESGTTRKTTAISAIKGIVSDSTRLITGKTSPENLELYLHDQTLKSGQATAHFAVGELVTILGREGYMATMPGLLTDLYDCPNERRSGGTIKSGEIIQKDVYVTFLSASTPAWLVTAINPSVIEGGFTSRVIFVVDDNRKRAIAWPKEHDEGARERVQGRFQSTVEGGRQFQSGLSLSRGGLDALRSWYNNRTTHTDPFSSSFEAREDDHVLRVGACLAINDSTLELQAKHIRNGIKIVRDVKARATTLFGGDFSQKARITEGISRLRDILIEAGTNGIKHSDLQRRIARRLDTKELKMLIDIMHECNMLSIFELKRGKMYRATRGIEKFGVTSEVLSRLNLH